MNYSELPQHNQWEEEIDNTPAIDPDEDASITQPFDPAKIRVETKPMSIDLLLQRIKHEELNLAPDFQRQDGIWKSKAKSRLIESLLIRIPLPAFYMDATDEDKWVVIDGLQRLSTLKSFVIDKTMRLEGLEFLSQLENVTYDELARHFQRRILETQVTVYLIEKGTPPAVKFNIFRRINTGGLPLAPQEIRHALNQGKSTELLRELASWPEFLQATAKSIPTNRMEDREFILRFMAFTLTPYTEYSAEEFDSFLNDAMKKINNMSDAQVESIKSNFKRSMNAAYDIFGDDAFRKRYRPNDGRKPINKSLFEAWSVNLSELDSRRLEILKERKNHLKQAFISLNNNKLFDSSISQGTSDINKVKIRFTSVHLLIFHILSEHFKDEFMIPFGVQDKHEIMQSA